MNTQTKPELFAPCFPKLSIKKSGIEIDADNVQFSFVVGNESIDCEIKAVELTDSMYVEQHFILTESQVYELNEWLEADAVEKFEMAQG